MDDDVSRKRKREVSRYDYGTVCICCNPACDAAMRALQQHNPSRHAYFDLPREPKPVAELKSKPKPAQRKAREMKSQRRQRMLKALPRAATVRVNDERYQRNAQHKIASLHFHDDIYNRCKDGEGKASLIDSIPTELALRLNREGLSFTETDKYQDGTYVPLPNVAPGDVVAYGDTLQSNAARAIETTPLGKISTRNSSVTPESMEIYRLKEQIERLNAQREVERQRAAAKEADLNQLKESLAQQQAEIIARQRDVNEKMQIVIAGENVYGLTRSSILSKSWHKKNPNAARHLLGFRSWKETVYTLHALFDVLPPLAIPNKKDHISLFEQYLMGFLRIHCRMTVYSIALIWDRNNGHTGRLINNAVKSIGLAGKDLSILDLTPEFLEATCPQQYKDEGLEKCCAVPDGKDFMIYTTRKNTMFTRACFSDKVHHSAARCISWSTPMGLSFEHTDLFLGRASEKRLVELWGPRLKKCPRGWYMLSDRGFFDTARFYPNMNHQLTPKFLSGRDQFTTDEVSADRRICKLRYTCEVAFSRVTKTKGLKDVISNDYFPLLDAMNHWGHATVNLDAPLMKL